MSRKKTKESTTSAKNPKAPSLRSLDPHLAREAERYESPLPSREYLLELIEAEGAPLPIDDFAARLDITADERPFFERRLAAMAREGQLMINRKGALCLPDKVDLIAGRVSGHPDGFGFLIPDDGSDDLYLGSKEMSKVLHGDRALVRQTGVDRRGRREGTIAEVLSRANTSLVGRFRQEHGVHIVTAEDKRISQEILVPPKETGHAKPGQIVVVELIQQPERHSQPVGRVVEILGHYDDPGMEIEIALRKHNLPHVFSPEAEAQAAKTPDKVKKADFKPVLGVKREDLRELPLVTIDGETARDFDDAVYAEKKGKGWRLVVAIADVSHYVQPDDALDVTSRERGNSVYFPRRVIPMLPEQLSNGICSLNPDVARLCMVCDMEVGPKGAIKSYRFYPAVMHSKARLTYTQAWDMIQHPKGPTAKQFKKVLPQVHELYALFQAFAAARAKRGAIDFETVETEIRFNEQGKIREIVPVHRNDAHKLIEECMLAANVCAAEFLLKHKHPALYRVHEGPNPEKLEVLREYLRTCGLSLGGGEDPSAEDYAQLLQQIKARPDAELLQTMLLRSLSQAVYTPDNQGHFGLGYEAYAHFTSPIRRYPDLLVHRSIKAVLAGKKYKPSQKWDALGAQCSMTERRADDASRDVLNFLKCYYMQDKVGEVFEGSIAAVTSFGMFVLLDDLYVEGLVHVSELGSDYFHYDERRRELKGERTGQVYRLTDRIRVKVARVDLETSKIDFVLAPLAPPAVPQPKGGDAGRRDGRPAARGNKKAERRVALQAQAAKPLSGAKEKHAQPQAATPSQAAVPPKAKAQPAASNATPVAQPPAQSGKAPRSRRRGKGAAASAPTPAPREAAPQTAVPVAKPGTAGKPPAKPVKPALPAPKAEVTKPAAPQAAKRKTATAAPASTAQAKAKQGQPAQAVPPAAGGMPKPAAATPAGQQTAKGNQAPVVAAPTPRAKAKPAQVAQSASPAADAVPKPASTKPKQSTVASSSSKSPTAPATAGRRRTPQVAALLAPKVAAPPEQAETLAPAPRTSRRRKEST
ncbi:ribonuclease R [Chitinolyticbacter meiyuanensis]|uniref:ribonuclease R n=1 Tax=Chitinolyticbacter meiyuanensis TaxID=682798 RepID=UPI0011E5D793|nr:ribonuclease R [Chitinolyticbacter meiyuanensis]